MTYEGNNPVGLALQNDRAGRVAERIGHALQALERRCEQRIREAGSPPDLLRLHVAAAECAALCRAAVQAFHADCHAAAAGHPGGARDL